MDADCHSLESLQKEAWRPMKTERRRHFRCRSPEPGYFIRDQGARIIGSIIDISPAGLAFNYPAAHRHVPVRLLIDITQNHGGSPVVRRLACKTVYDIQVLSENLAFKRGVEVRRCGLAFLDPAEKDLSRVADMVTRCQIAK
jgi:hypothetical protein